MPKQRISAEMLMDAAMGLLEERGRSGVTAAAVAERAGCSVQPVYTCWTNMDELWHSLEQRAAEKLHAFVRARLDPQDLFRSTGRAFAAAAAEHPHLFQLFAFRQRPGIRTLSELLATEADPALAAQIAEDLQVSLEAARRLHLQMLVFNVGLCTVLASADPALDPEEVFGQLEAAYEAFAAQAAARGADV